jgi:HAD superfamily hydrolase (TIGR01490 family)
VTLAAAFFDLDRTLMAGSSGLHFGRAAYRSGMVRRRVLAGWALDNARFRLRGSTDEATERVLTQVKELLAGVPARDLERLAPDVLAGVLPRIYPQMLDEVRAHQDAGRLTAIVSAAGSGLVEPLAHVLAMDAGIGTRYAVGEDGSMTGDLEGPFMYGEGKAEAIREFAREHEIDLAQSWAYSDSASDLPMLWAVGNAVVVNPDAELTRIAAAQGWRVMRFEKLGRRLAIAGATLIAAAVGGSGTLLATRRRPRRRTLPSGLPAARPRVRRR